MTAADGRPISDAERRHRLVQRHRLTRSSTADGAEDLSPVAVARSVVALHSSDPVSVYLSVLARSPEATIESVTAALYEDRELLRVHGMRRTLWVADVDTARQIVAASADRLERAERRRLASMLADAGEAGPEAWIDDACAEILAFVLDEGVVDTQAVGEALPHRAIGMEMASGKKYAATIAAHTRILLILGYGGHIVRAEPRGTWIASQYRWADPVAWTGRPLAGADDHAADEVAAAQAAIIERYLLAFGPVTTDDVVWWTGWPKGAVTKALARLGAIEVELDGRSGWLSPDDDRRASADPGDDELDGSVALLPALDPTTMGWKHRGHYLDPSMTKRLYDRNGNGGQTIWLGGRIVGGWAQRDDGELVKELLVDVGSEAEQMVDDELDRLAERIGETRYKVRFPNPLNTELRR